MFRYGGQLDTERRLRDRFFWRRVHDKLGNRNEHPNNNYYRHRKFDIKLLARNAGLHCCRNVRLDNRYSYTRCYNPLTRHGTPSLVGN
jgi:hypothetical protein